MIFVLFSTCLFLGAVIGWETRRKFGDKLEAEAFMRGFREGRASVPLQLGSSVSATFSREKYLS